MFLFDLPDNIFDERKFEVYHNIQKSRFDEGYRRPGNPYGEFPDARSPSTLIAPVDDSEVGSPTFGRWQKTVAATTRRGPDWSVVRTPTSNSAFVNG